MSGACTVDDCMFINHAKTGMKNFAVSRLRLLIFLPLLVLAGCQPTVYLMPTPVGIQQGKHDPFADTPYASRSSEIVIGYATNRLPASEPDSGKLIDYSRRFDDGLRMGVARVEIGDGDKSWEEIYRVSLRGATDKEVRLHLNEIHQNGVLAGDDAMGPFESLPANVQAMMLDFNKAIDDTPDHELTIYVHGANSNFYRAAAQTAQFRHFSGNHMLVLMYAWPSAENILRYGSDVNNIMETAPGFARFLSFLGKYSSAKSINILAYSAGATLTTQALTLLADQAPQGGDRQAYAKSLKLGSVYFAAPDTDFDAFIDQYRSYQDLLESATVTINNNDSVLSAARKYYHAGRATEDDNGKVSSKSRLGKPNLEDLSQSQADWIAAQTFKPEFSVLNIDWQTIPGLEKGSHDYWYRNPWTSTDVLLSFGFRAAPQERALDFKVIDDRVKIWNFPVDYETRVDTALDALVDKYRQQSQ